MLKFDCVWNFRHLLHVRSVRNQSPRVLSDMVHPVPVGHAPPTKPTRDATVERLRELQLQVWQLAYCRDVVTALPANIKGVGMKQQDVGCGGAMMVGRAYTVEGPDVYVLRLLHV